jgi:hypothetical protein
MKMVSFLKLREALCCSYCMGVVCLVSAKKKVLFCEVFTILYIKATAVVFVCVGSAWKILPIIARSPEITHLNTLNRAFLIVSVFGHLEFACTGGFTKT